MGLLVVSAASTACQSMGNIFQEFKVAKMVFVAEQFLGCSTIHLQELTGACIVDL